MASKWRNIKMMGKRPVVRPRSDYPSGLSKHLPQTFYSVEDVHQMVQSGMGISGWITPEGEIVIKEQPGRPNTYSSSELALRAYYRNQRDQGIDSVLTPESYPPEEEDALMGILYDGNIAFNADSRLFIMEATRNPTPSQSSTLDRLVSTINAPENEAILDHETLFSGEHFQFAPNEATEVICNFYV